MAIRDIADRFDDVLFVYPVHLNPNVQEPVNRFLRGHQHIHLVEPLTYAPFVWLMNRATIDPHRLRWCAGRGDFPGQTPLGAERDN